jgi:hypothetical protein
MIRVAKKYIGLLPAMALAFVAYTSCMVAIYAAYTGGDIGNNPDALLLLATGLAATAIDFTVDKIS